MRKLSKAVDVPSSPTCETILPSRRRVREDGRFRRKVSVGSISLVLALSVGIAAATWTADGAGSGQSKAATPTSVVVNAATGAADLYPGFTAGDVYFTLTNDNPYAITFTSMTPGAITSDNGSCAGSNISVASASSLNLSVGANSTTGTLSIPDVVSMTSSAPDACKGVTFSIQLTLSGAQS